MASGTSPLGGTLWKPGAQAPTTLGGRTFIPAAYYPSSSNPKNGYTVCEVSDGSVSCNCMGWTRRNPPGGRTCKHTQDYETYLRPMWKQIQSGQVPVGASMGVPEPTVQATDKDKGGTLGDLFKKLDKGGL